VSAKLAERVRQQVAGIEIGMRVAEAMDIVFGQQQMVLFEASQGSERDGQFRLSSLQKRPTKAEASFATTGVGQWHDPAALTPDEAKSLTERIRAGATGLSLLIMEAHQRRAWHVLGYKTWERYVRTELGISRSRSYELLEHARVLLTLKTAARLRECPDVSAHVADRIKPILAELTEELQRKTDGLSEDAAEKVVAELVKARAGRHGRGSIAAKRQGALQLDSARLVRTIEYLSTMPSPAVAAALLSTDDWERLTSLSTASDWLAEFARHAASHSPDQTETELGRRQYLAAVS
jgi:hypothetical protein